MRSGLFRPFLGSNADEIRAAIFWDETFGATLEKLTKFYKSKIYR